jgi:hypothetical protein
MLAGLRSRRLRPLAVADYKEGYPACKSNAPRVKAERYDKALDEVLRAYQQSFLDKEFAEAESATDILMEVYGITPTLRAANRQYWGRELGMCWQRLCTELCRECCGDRYAAPRRYGDDEPYDFSVDDLAIDTKYRVGSGDAGTLKKFKANGRLLSREGLRPTMLILRGDNLASAVGACKAGGWEVLIGTDSFKLLMHLTGGFDLEHWLRRRSGAFPLTPP